jgi:hypothetical protein
LREYVDDLRVHVKYILRMMEDLHQRQNDTATIARTNETVHRLQNKENKILHSRIDNSLSKIKSNRRENIAVTGTLTCMVFIIAVLASDKIDIMSILSILRRLTF